MKMLIFYRDYIDEIIYVKFIDYIFWMVIYAISFMVFAFFGYIYISSAMIIILQIITVLYVGARFVCWLSGVRRPPYSMSSISDLRANANLLAMEKLKRSIENEERP